jgi:hypothetical protein
MKGESERTDTGKTWQSVPPKGKHHMSLADGGSGIRGFVYGTTYDIIQGGTCVKPTWTPARMDLGWTQSGILASKGFQECRNPQSIMSLTYFLIRHGV